MIYELTKVALTTSKKSLTLQFVKQTEKRDMKGAGELRFKSLDQFEIEDLGAEGLIIRIKSNERKKRSFWNVITGGFVNA